MLQSVNVFLPPGRLAKPGLGPGGCVLFCPAPRVTCHLPDLLHPVARAEPCRSSHLLVDISRDGIGFFSLLKSSSKNSCISSSSQSKLAKKAWTGSWTSAHRNKCISIVQPFRTVLSNRRTDFSIENENIKLQTFLRIYFPPDNKSFSPQESKILYFFRIHPQYSTSECFS